MTTTKAAKVILETIGDPDSGTVAPGTNGAIFRSPFRTSAVAADGGYAFKANIAHTLHRPDSGMLSGIWDSTDGGIRLIALQGQEAPGTNGAAFGDLNVFVISAFFARNSVGDIAFTAKLTGENVDDGNDFGLWAYASVLDSLVLIAREGDTVDISDAQDGSDTQRIQRIPSRPLDPTTTHRPPFITDDGRLVYTLLVRDEGWTFVTTLPQQPDKAACSTDLNGDNTVDAIDLMQLLGAWGHCQTQE